MIVCRVFENDGNEALKDVQHGEYMRSVGSIFRAARAVLAQADAIIGSDLLIVERSRQVRTFDHRVLQDAHDILAAAFRHEADDGGQLILGEDAQAQLLRYRNQWLQWLDGKLQDLVRYPQFVRSVVECVIFQNTEMGYMAENRVGDILLTHFSAGDWAFPDGYLKTYQPARA